MNIFMLICVGIIVLSAIIYSIYNLTQGLICCSHKCYKRNNGYTVVELENVINIIDNLQPSNKRLIYEQLELQ